MDRWTIRPMVDLPVDDDLLRKVVPWVHEAGNPYYDWLFGDPAAARRFLTAALRRPTSEAAAERVRLLLLEGEPIGGYVALSGAELVKARRTDAPALFAGVSRGGRDAMMRRLRASATLFPAPAPDDTYLSKLGVLLPWRRKGLGRRLLLHCVKASGTRRIRLDVSVGNDAARPLYTSFGFTIQARNVTPDGALEYLSMTRAAAAGQPHLVLGAGAR